MSTPIVIHARRGTPVPEVVPPPHVPVTGERQWEFFYRDVDVHAPITARDHRPRLVNGAAASRLYAALGLAGDTALLRLTPDAPGTHREISWQVEFELRGETTLKYGERYFLRASVWSAGIEDHGILTMGPGSVVVGSVRDTNAGRPIHLLESTSLIKPEWEIVGGSSGSPVRTNEWFALKNSWIGDTIVLDPAGVALDGTSPFLQTTRRAALPALEALTTTVRLDPNIPYQGLITWHTRFPILGVPRPGAQLTGLRVAKRHSFPVSLTFWSGTRGTFDVRVAEGAAMTAVQLADVFGSATPALPLEMWSLVQATQTIDVNGVFVELDYRG